MDSGNRLIELKDIVFAYDSGQSVFDRLHFELDRGERVGIMGPNGSGKTTLLHLIVGLLKPQAGEVKLFGKARTEEKDFVPVREKVGLVFQDPDDQLFCPTVAEDVAFGPLNLGKTREEVNDIVRETLSTMGLEGFQNRVTHKLSFGEKKLVALATVLAMAPEVLLLDEPSEALDKKNKERLIQHLAQLNQSLVIASHDSNLLHQIVNSIYRLSNGRLEGAE
jgi:cobalt/nickel transport system ATP-binding protein